MVTLAASMFPDKVSQVGLPSNAMEQGTWGAEVEVGARVGPAPKAPQPGYCLHLVCRALLLQEQI